MTEYYTCTETGYRADRDQMIDHLLARVILPEDHPLDDDLPDFIEKILAEHCKPGNICPDCNGVHFVGMGVCLNCGGDGWVEVVE